MYESKLYNWLEFPEEKNPFCERGMNNFLELQVYIKRKKWFDILAQFGQEKKQ